ncbi:hypothetical protein N7452_003125 [Penicillium brevicompactum]|uniref:Uncharacterized protein n=1 Tax=Penicillium brevicompactum TaxID=5074 RepID=A0A9W9QSY9_PENBR|nr:hypothetical protein N7452_003125 [Penicillium brevicompactum]
MTSAKESTLLVDYTTSGKWSAVNRVTVPNLGAASVAAIYNKHGFVISAISAGENKETTATAKLCQQYKTNKSTVFGNEDAMVWILYEKVNAIAGPTLKPGMMDTQPVKTSVQIYDGESYMAKTNDAGAKFSIALSGGGVQATLQRQDGQGTAVVLSGNGTVIKCP